QIPALRRLQRPYKSFRSGGHLRVGEAVGAPLSLRPAARAAGTPCTEGTGPICRIPSRGFSPTRLGLLTQGHLCQFLVRSHGLTPTPFSRAPRISGRACAPTPACIPFSPLRHSGDFNG